DGADERDPRRARPFHRLRMARARDLDRARDGRCCGAHREGHEFSRAVMRNRMTWAVAPEGASSMTSREFVVTKLMCLLSIFIILLAPTLLSAQTPAFDLIITHGHIIDGTGSPWYSGDLGIRDGKIAAIGNLEKAGRARTIDAHGEVVAPGFIDMLGQSELSILVEPRVPSKIFQGITTEITGEGN